ncbi:hypothetical protein AB0N88_08545 [Streptomyces sp. NPDC093516]|jgi:hypothetical protein|uniref:hypothetical protein n=1 Tax=Streptomyces sp. NPDC093516 TaxID=3155304 RepID=UPI00343D7FA0
MGLVTQVRIGDLSKVENILHPTLLTIVDRSASSLLDIMANNTDNLSREKFFCSNTCDIVSHC